MRTFRLITKASSLSSPCPSLSSRSWPRLSSTANMSSTSGLPPPLSASNRASFAYPTLKDRVPIIICKVIDLLHRNRSKKTADEREDLKRAVEEMSRLRYEIQTNKPFKPIEDGYLNEDAWNKYLKEETEKNGGETPTWFNTKWLYAECYAYRRLLQSFRLTDLLKNEDFFEIQKRESFNGSWEAMQNLMKILRDVKQKLSQESFPNSLVKEDFSLFLKISLWGNKCDLSISAGSHQAFEGCPRSVVDTLGTNVIVDESSHIWKFIESRENSDNRIVDIVLDNVGFELISDLVLADFLTETKLFDQIRFRSKNQPWFVSDTMPKDLEWTLDEMQKLTEDGNDLVIDKDIILKTINTWRENFKKGIWSMHDDLFWTYPQDYSYMKTVAPELYRSLSESQIIIFKGDLNYRKLVGDLSWDPTTSFKEALLGFNPSPVVALRTLKADVVVGLTKDQPRQISALDKDWMINGNWATIQFCDHVDPI